MHKPLKHISVEQEIKYAIEMFKNNFGIDLNSMDNIQQNAFIIELENIAKAGYNQAMDKVLSLYQEQMDMDSERILMSK